LCHDGEWCWGVARRLKGRGGWDGSVGAGCGLLWQGGFRGGAVGGS